MQLVNCLRDLELSVIEVDGSLPKKLGASVLNFLFGISMLNVAALALKLEISTLDSWRSMDPCPEKLGACVLNVLFRISKLKVVALAFMLGVSILDPLWS